MKVLGRKPSNQLLIDITFNMVLRSVTRVKRKIKYMRKILISTSLVILSCYLLYLENTLIIPKVVELVSEKNVKISDSLLKKFNLELSSILKKSYNKKSNAFLMHKRSHNESSRIYLDKRYIKSDLKKTPLSKVYITSRKSQKNISKNCRFLVHQYFPLCLDKVYYLKNEWKSEKCFYDTHKIDGSQCSIYNYLTEVEPFCMGKKELYNHSPSQDANLNLSIYGLLELLPAKEFRWLRSRITFLWSSWLSAANSFALNRSKHARKKILAFLGAGNTWMFESAGRGGPLGELIQWSDLITGLYILGHDFKVSRQLTDVIDLLQIEEGGCAQKRHNFPIDVIYTDIYGYITLLNKIGSSKLAKFNCLFRLLDSFGTFPEFNFNLYNLPRGGSPWGDLNLVITQFLTLYPHTPDNRFLGFVIPRREESSVNQTKTNRALLYAKLSSYINHNKNNERYLKIISEYFDIHATCQNDVPLPSYITNHGSVSGEKVNELLSESKLFIGLGFPYEGPGPLEAMANGVVYLQPYFDKPINKLNDRVFAGKPTSRQLNNQNPYMESIGEPYCYTINITDEALLRKTLHKIKTMKRNMNYVPKEFTSVGFLERLYVFTNLVDFCNPYSPRWPPIDNLHIRISRSGESCKDACVSHDLVCESTYFKDLNYLDVMRRSNLTCHNSEHVMDLHAPSYHISTRTCYLQYHQQVFSCMSQKREIKRLCPCRDYEHEQTAICKNCL